MTSTAGVPSDDHQPQLHTAVKPEDALRMLLLSEFRESLSPSSPPMQPSRSLSCETGRSPELHRAGVDPPDEEFSWTKKYMISRSLSSDACDTGTSPKWHDPQSPALQRRHREDAAVGPFDEELSWGKNDLRRFSLPPLTRKKPASLSPKPQHAAVTLKRTPSFQSGKSTSSPKYQSASSPGARSAAHTLHRRTLERTDGRVPSYSPTRRQRLSSSLTF